MRYSPTYWILLLYLQSFIKFHEQTFNQQNMIWSLSQISKVIEEQSYMLPEGWFGFPLEKMQLHLNWTILNINMVQSVGNSRVQCGETVP